MESTFKIWIVICLTVFTMKFCDGLESPCMSNFTASHYSNNVTFPDCLTCSGKCGEKIKLNITNKNFCSCDSMCSFYGDCCPDFQEQCPEEHRGQVYKTRFHRINCVSYMYSPDYLVVSSCMSNDSECQTSKKSPETYVPVYDPNTKIHYSNFRCAVCNGAKHVIPWEMTIICKERIQSEFGFNLSSSVPVNKTEELWYLIQNDTCNGKIDPPDKTPEPRKCISSNLLLYTSTCPAICSNSKLIEECETGGWTYAAAPRMTVYKNLACMLCNSPDHIDSLNCYLTKGGRNFVPGNPPKNWFSFTLLFDFTIERPEINTVTNCPVGQIWIPREQKCRPLSRRKTFINRYAYIFIANLPTKSLFNITIKQGIIQFDPRIELLAMTHDKEKTITSLIFSYEREGGFIDNETQSIATTIQKILLLEDNNMSYYSYRLSGLDCNKTVEYKQNEFVFEFNGTLKLTARQSRFVIPGEYIPSNSTILVCPDLRSHNCSNSKPNDQQIPYTLSPLDIVTLVFCVISILCLMMRILLHFLVPSESDRVAARLQVCLSLALLLGYTAFLLRIAAFTYTAFCYFLAVLLHWAFLAAFCWMTVIAVDIARMFRNSHLLKKVGTRKKSFLLYSLCAWVIPLIIVVIAIIVDNANGQPTLCDHTQDQWKPAYMYRCWISSTNALLIFFIFPAAAFLFINIVLFIISVCYLYHAHKNTVNTSSPSYLRKRVVLHINLLVLMGLTWTFGFLAAPLKQLWLWYIFVILNASQGVLILTVFLLTQQVRRILQEKYSSWSKSSSSAFISKSTVSTTSYNDIRKPVLLNKYQASNV